MAPMQYAVVNGSGYHDQVYVADHRTEVVDAALQQLKPIQEDFDTIAVRGVSGLTVGSILAHVLHKHLIVVRKDGESSHGHAIEGVYNALYLIVDDFEVSGETIRRIREGAEEKLQGVFVGTYLWRDRTLMREDTMTLKANRVDFILDEAITYVDVKETNDEARAE